MKKIRKDETVISIQIYQKHLCLVVRNLNATDKKTSFMVGGKTTLIVPNDCVCARECVYIYNSCFRPPCRGSFFSPRGLNVSLCKCLVYLFSFLRVVSFADMQDRFIFKKNFPLLWDWAMTSCTRRIFYRSRIIVMLKFFRLLALIDLALRKVVF